MTAATWIAIAALGLALLTFVATQFGSKRTSTASYVQQLEARVTRLEEQLRAARVRVQELEAENLRLMRRVLRQPTSEVDE